MEGDSAKQEGPEDAADAKRQSSVLACDGPETVVKHPKIQEGRKAENVTKLTKKFQRKTWACGEKVYTPSSK